MSELSKQNIQQSFFATLTGLKEFVHSEYDKINEVLAVRR
jgi:hypothetical protein